jgi:hypothetical protein
MIKKIVLSAGILALLMSLTGCGGSETKTTVQTTETQGQQLIDLKAAYDEGIISENEYEKTKHEILKGN